MIEVVGSDPPGSPALRPRLLYTNTELGWGHVTIVRIRRDGRLADEELARGDAVRDWSGPESMSAA